MVLTVRKISRIAMLHTGHKHTRHKYVRIKIINEAKIEIDYAKQA